MEPVKNRLTQLGRNAGAFVVNADADVAADSRGNDFDQPARRRETDRIVDDIVDRAGKAGRVAVLTPSR